MTDAANVGTLIHHLPTESPSDDTKLQVDLQTWRILKKALRTGLLDRGIVVGDDEASLMTRFMLEEIENKWSPCRPGETYNRHAASHQASS
ncbi:hypothetical protein ACC689_29165 [Rhizobium ruizarguesonis]